MTSFENNCQQTVIIIIIMKDSTFALVKMKLGNCAFPAVLLCFAVSINKLRSSDMHATTVVAVVTTCLITQLKSIRRPLWPQQQQQRDLYGPHNVIKAKPDGDLFSHAGFFTITHTISTQTQHLLMTASNRTSRAVADGI